MMSVLAAFITILENMWCFTHPPVFWECFDHTEIKAPAKTL